jgi:6-pyruvoyltetrahydropterin/6-carboxytetrahydropterin synthase
MKKKAGQFLVTVAGSFDAAHRLRLSGTPCEKLHGHGWRLEASFTAPLGRDGIVRDFVELERELKKRVISTLDHSDLNDLFEKPTTELIARWIWARLAPLGVVEVRLWETPNYSVTYRG